MYEKIIKLASIGETPATISARLGLTQDVLRQHYHKALQLGYKMNNGECKRSSTDYERIKKSRAEAGDPKAIEALKRKREAEKAWRKKNKEKCREYQRLYRESIKNLIAQGDPKAIETQRKYNERHNEYKRRARQKKAIENASKQETTTQTPS